MLLAEDQEVSQQGLTCVRVGVGVRDVGGVEVQLPRGSQVRLDAAHALAVAQLLVLCTQARLAVRLRPHSPPSTPELLQETLDQLTQSPLIFAPISAVA